MTTKSTKNTAPAVDLSTEQGREAAYYPIFQTEAWAAAQEAANNALDQLAEAIDAHADVASRFMDDDPSVTAGDVREHELLLARAERRAETAREASDWLTARREKDSASLTRNGMVLGLFQKRLKKRHLTERLAEATGTERAKRLHSEQERTSRAVADAVRIYHDRVTDVETRLAQGRDGLTAAKAQDVADIFRAEKDEQVKALNDSFAEYKAEHEAHVRGIRSDLADIEAFLREFDPSYSSAKLVRG